MKCYILLLYYRMITKIRYSIYVYVTLLNNRVTGKWGKYLKTYEARRNFRKSSVPIGKKMPHLRKPGQ